MTKVITNIKTYAALSLVAIASFLALGSTAHAAYVDSTRGGITGGTNLGQLIVLDQLFDGDRDGGTMSNVGRLIVLDSIFSGGRFGTVGMGTVGTGLGGNSLGQLIVLDKLFADGRSDNNDGGEDNQQTRGDRSDSIFGDLGELIVLDGLFSGNLGTFGGTSVPGTTVTGGNTVVVQSGDTLSGIASAYLGDASLYPLIAQYNGIANPSLIYPGQRLVIPNVSSTTTGSVFNQGITGSNSLGQLIVLDNMFSNGGGDGGTFSGVGELIVLDSLFNGSFRW
jgi:hypothetical protein